MCSWFISTRLWLMHVEFVTHISASAGYCVVDISDLTRGSTRTEFVTHPYEVRDSFIPTCVWLMHVEITASARILWSGRIWFTHMELMTHSCGVRDSFISICSWIIYVEFVTYVTMSAGYCEVGEYDSLKCSWWLTHVEFVTHLYRNVCDSCGVRNSYYCQCGICGGKGASDQIRAGKDAVK